MRNIKPKPMEHGSGPHKISPDETAPSPIAPEFAASTAPAAPIASARPDAVAEPEPEIVSASAEPQTDSRDDPWAAFSDAHAVLARGWEEFAVTVSGMSQSGIAAAAEAAGALLGATTFSEAVEINAALARRGTGVLIESSAKLAEISVKAISELSQPILSRFGARWTGEAMHG